METNVTQELSFGQKLVGIGFNPAGDDKVPKAKKLCAELADLLNDEWQGNQNSYPENSLKSHLYQHTIGEILNAQMNVVKFLTLKY